MQYNLPRGYLSHSSMELWKQSKDRFRKKYYGSGEPDVVTAYMSFGKEVAEILEDKQRVRAHPILKKIPAYDYPEYPLENVAVCGVPIKGFIDSFDTKKHRIIEYKTGLQTGGAPKWDAVKVKKHNQVLLYSVCIEELLGRVHPNTKLVWLETCWKERCEDRTFGNKVFKQCVPALDLTGDFKVFPRTIEEWEKDWMRNELVRIATEISEDYTRYQENSVEKRLI